jgi:glycine cleavage system aminomethyltransferase T
MRHSTPLHHLASARSAPFVRYHDREIVDHYGLPRQEYDIVRAGAGVFDASYLGKLRVSGRDGPGCLNRMLSND